MPIGRPMGTTRCGDQLRVYLVLDGETVHDIKFEGAGCAISEASASLMTEAVKGKTVGKAEALFKGFHDLMTGSDFPPPLGVIGACVGLSSQSVGGASTRDQPTFSPAPALSVKNSVTIDSKSSSFQR